MFARRQLAYNIDGVRGARVHGWAFARRAPQRRLCISVEAQGRSLGIVRADVYRADVQRAEHGHDGYCGFTLPATWLAQRDASLFVLDPRCVLPIRSRPASAAGRTIESAGVSLHLDADPHRLSGWIVASRDPDRRVRLRITTGGDEGAEQTASLHRSEACHFAGDGFHGFSMARPPGPQPIELWDADDARLIHRLDART